MIKCHCAEVFFEDVIRHVQLTQRPILEVARELGAASTCTACVGDLLEYIGKRMEDSILAGSPNH